MRKILLGLAATALVATPLVAATSANAAVERQCETVTTGTGITTATFTVNQPKDTTTQFANVWRHDYTVTVQSDGTFAGTGSITDNGGAVTWTETITGSFNTARDHITFATVPVGGGATFAVTDAPMDSTTVPVVTSWTANIVEFQIGQATLTTEGTSTTYKNHGQYVAAMGGGKDAAQSCVGMPVKSNKVT